MPNLNNMAFHSNFPPELPYLLQVRIIDWLFRITITNADYNTVFEIKDAVRKDTAKYKVKFTNNLA